MTGMKKLSVTIDADLDEVLELEAARSGISKSALVRTYIRERLESIGAREEDPLNELIGAIDAEPGDIDEVVYGARDRSS